MQTYETSNKYNKNEGKIKQIFTRKYKNNLLAFKGLIY